MAFENLSDKLQEIFKNLKGRNYKVVNCMDERFAEGTFANDLCSVDVPLCGIVFVK